MRYRLVPALSAVVLAGCTNPFGEVSCTASVEPAVVVEIRDARTGAAIAAGARGAVRDGLYLDSLRPYASSGTFPDGLYSRRAADERPGTYVVEVQHLGYRPWMATGVQVDRGECHVGTRTLRAALEPI